MQCSHSDVIHKHDCLLSQILCYHQLDSANVMNGSAPITHNGGCLMRQCKAASKASQLATECTTGQLTPRQQQLHEIRLI